MDVSDSKVILIFFGANFKASNKDVLEFAGVELSGSSVDKLGKVLVELHIEACVPLTIFGLEGDVAVGESIRHLGTWVLESKLRSELSFLPLVFEKRMSYFL